MIRKQILNHENIGVNYEAGQVTLMDCDSFHINNDEGQVFRTNVIMPGYLAPEIIEHCKMERLMDHEYTLDKVALPTFTQESDLFCLGIHNFKLLMNGVDPFRGVKVETKGSTASPFVGNEAIERNAYVFREGNKPSAVFCPPANSLPKEILALFDRAFIDGKEDPSKRPTAAEWYHALSDYLTKLTDCTENAKHQYYKELSECPYCVADDKHLVAQGGTVVEIEHPVKKIGLEEQKKKKTNESDEGLKPEKEDWISFSKGLIISLAVILFIIVFLLFLEMVPLTSNRETPAEQEISLMVENELGAMAEESADIVESSLFVETNYPFEISPNEDITLTIQGFELLGVSIYEDWIYFVYLCHEEWNSIISRFHLNQMEMQRFKQEEINLGKISVFNVTGDGDLLFLTHGHYFARYERDNNKFVYRNITDAFPTEFFICAYFHMANQTGDTIFTYWDRENESHYLYTINSEGSVVNKVEIKSDYFEWDNLCRSQDDRIFIFDTGGSERMLREIDSSTGIYTNVSYLIPDLNGWIRRIELGQQGSEFDVFIKSSEYYL